jgi:hypothetical protein
MDKDKFKESLDEEVKRRMSIWMENAAKEHFRHEFAKFDCETLSKMTNKELAAWQAKFPMDSPQYIIALQEWNRRATVEQTKWMKRSIYIGFAGIIIGAILTAFVTWFLPPQKAENNISIQQQTKENKTTDEAQNKQTNIKAPIRQKP